MGGNIMADALEYAKYFVNRYHMVMLIVLFAPNDIRAIPEECNDGEYPVLRRITE
jgi:hypothetical protein